MRTVPSWDQYFMDMAVSAAARSKDPRTNVGAVLVDRQHRIISIGYNGFGDGIAETAHRWQSDEKHKYVIHAEVNALLNAARVGNETQGSTLYVTLAPCPNCALNVIAAGVEMVVTPRAAIKARLDERPELLRDYYLMLQLFEEADIRYFEV